jgi:hypothetical protein
MKKDKQIKNIASTDNLRIEKFVDGMRILDRHQNLLHGEECNSRS